MSAVPFSYRQYAGNGSTTTFSVPFQYLLKAHVKVYLGFNILDGTFSSELVDGAGFTWSSSSQIQCTTPPASGQTLTVIRQTPNTTRLVDWQDGSNLISDDLDTSDLQNLYVVQEQQDRNAAGIAQSTTAFTTANAAAAASSSAVATAAAAYPKDGSAPMTGDIAAGGFRVKDVGAPVQATDAATKGYVDGYINTYYLGGLNNDPVTRPGGSSLQSGDYYVNLPTYQLRYYNGSQWKDVDYETEQDRIAAEVAKAAAELAAANADLAKVAAQTAKAQAETAVVNAQAAQTAAELAETGALGAKAGAEAARDSAIIQAGLYPDEATGRAAVADGQAFKVQGTTDIAAFEYRRINATTSTLIATYPSANYIYSLRYEIGEYGLTKYKGSGPTYPIVIDRENRVVFGYNTATGNLDGLGLINLDNLYDRVTAGVISPLSVGNYTGSGPVYPIVTDRENKVVLGYDTESNSLVGPGIGQASPAPVVSTSNRVPLASPPIEKAVNHIIFYGQSLSVGAAGGAIVSTTQPYSNITFNGGPRAYTGTAFDFSAFKPLVEDATRAPDGNTNRTETPCSGAANYATTLSVTEAGRTPASHVILASTAGKGGARIDELKKGTAWYVNTFLPHINGARNLNTNYAVHAFGWVQGENDSTPGRQTPYATYRADLNQLQIDIENDVKAITGQTSPVYCLTYQTVASARTWKDQCLAQLNLAQTNSKFFLATPIYHLPHAGDAVHLTSTGYKWMGAYFGRAYKSLVIDGLEPQWLNPVSAYIRGNVVTVRFDVPVKPLVIDTTTLAVTTDKGFKVLDGATAATISSIESQDDKVVITLASEPTGAVTVRYALDYLGAGLNITGGGSGNLRDSNPETITISGVARPLYNVCPHFEMAAITLGE